MKLITFFSVIFNLLGFFMQQPNGIIEGQIYVDRLGLLLSNTEIIFNLEDGSYRKVITDENGYYKIKDLPLANYKLSVIADGFAKKELSIVVKADEKKLVNIGLQVTSNITLSKDRLFGVVKTFMNKPVQGANITAISTLDCEIISNTITDSKGCYSIEIEGNQVALIVSKFGFKQEVRNFFLESSKVYEREAINFVLEKSENKNIILPQTVCGQVMDAKGLFVFNAFISVISTTTSQTLLQTVTDMNGIYKLRLDIQDKIILVISKPGYKSVIIPNSENFSIPLKTKLAYITENQY